MRYDEFSSFLTSGRMDAVSDSEITIDAGLPNGLRRPPVADDRIRLTARDTTTGMIRLDVHFLDGQLWRQTGYVDVSCNDIHGLLRWNDRMVLMMMEHPERILTAIGDDVHGSSVAAETLGRTAFANDPQSIIGLAGIHLRGPEGGLSIWWCDDPIENEVGDLPSPHPSMVTEVEAFETTDGQIALRLS